MEAKVFKMNGTESGSVKLSDEVFGVKAHPQTINDIVKAQLCNERQGTVDTKTRGEMSGSTRKLYRQKGTGRARQGDIKSPLHVGGGCTFGPKQKIYDQRPPKKVVDKALRGVLYEMASEGKISVIDNLDFSKGKTRDVTTLMDCLKVVKLLVVLPGTHSDESLSDAEKERWQNQLEMTRRATSNLKNAKVVTTGNVTVVDLLKYGNVAICDKALKQLEEELSK